MHNSCYSVSLGPATSVTQHHKSCYQTHTMHRLLSRQHDPFTISILCSTLQFAGSNPAEAVRIFQGAKILSTPSFGREVKPWLPRRRLGSVKCGEFID